MYIYSPQGMVSTPEYIVYNIVLGNIYIYMSGMWPLHCSINDNNYNYFAIISITLDVILHVLFQVMITITVMGNE